MTMISRAVTALQRDVPSRILGMVLLVATLDPARIDNALGAR